MQKKVASFCLGLLALTIAPAVALDNGLGLTPQMGWNSWNQFACNVTEDLIKHAADRMIDLGLDKLGYKYVNVDDCWMDYNRSADGHLVPDPVNFPSGMKALSDYMHEKGMKFGLYESSGTMTCQKRAGSLHHEEIDAQDFADWEVDYLKFDNCYN